MVYSHHNNGIIALYLHWVVVILKTEGEVVVVFVSIGAIRYLAYVIVVGLVLLQVVVCYHWLRVVGSGMDRVHRGIRCGMMRIRMVDWGWIS